ncbi:MAG: 4Fe-4S binding protein [Syntrophaceae bacterium]|nr:4Fe-4S binding protein [Syntrophaceae bacterium]
MLRSLRRGSQVLFLLIFLALFLQTESKGENLLSAPVKFFLDADPLLWLTTLLSTRSLTGFWSPALVVLAATLLLGRAFCGWICPLGALHDLAGRLGRKQSRKHRPFDWFQIKYLLLFAILAASLFTLQTAGLFDPLSLTIRSLSLSLYPAFQHSATAIFAALYAVEIPLVSGGVEFVHEGLKQTLLAFRQPQFHQAFFLGTLFIGLLALNLRERRFWCRYLCPLGALLGLCSRHALLNRSVSEGCDGCGVCRTACPMNTAGGKNDRPRPNECVVCLSCDDLCPRRAVRFGFSRRRGVEAPDLSRRHILASLAAGVAAVPLLRVTPLAKAPSPQLIRPPGSRSEVEFLRRCVKCGKCMKVCITGGLQPTLFETGLEGLWTPVLVPRIGYCEYHCTLCGQVCPTGAIERLEPEEKTKVRIGLAMIDPGRCLPYSHGIPCIVCEEVCPTPEKAIWLEETEPVGASGDRTILKRPHVALERCIGCGICEAHCPVRGRPAIAVTALGESRSPDQQLLF